MHSKHILLTCYTVILMCLVSCAPAKGNMYPLTPNYIRETKLYAELQRLTQLQPALVQNRIIGFSSHENLPIYALEIGKKQAKRQVLIIGQHHGDEVLGVNVSLAWAEKLLNGYKTDESIKNLLDKYRFWIVPTINPEGWRIVSSGQFQFKRKNNRDTDGNKKLDLRTDGVDLNRNYPVFWDIDPESNPESPYYKGTEPASENEVKSVVSLAQQQNFALAIFLHSSASGAYSEKLYLPAKGGDSTLYAQTKTLATIYAKAVKKDYATGTYEVHNGISSEVGNARNFFFHRLGTRAFLMEIGGINAKGQSIIHPGDKMLQKIVNKHLNALTKLFDRLDEVLGPIPPKP